MSAFLAAGIDNVSTLLFRDETFCDKMEIENQLITILEEKHTLHIYLQPLSAREISAKNTQKKRARENPVSEGE